MIILLQLFIPIISAILMPLLKKNIKVLIGFIILSGILSLLGGIKIFLAVMLFISFTFIASLLHKGTITLLFYYALTVSPLLFHLMSHETLRLFKAIPLHLDPVITISYLAGFDIARGRFSYKYLDLADYFFFQPDLSLYTITYTVVCLSLLISYFGLTKLNSNHQQML